MSTLDFFAPPFRMFRQSILPNGRPSQSNHIALGTDTIFSYFTDTENSEEYVAAFNFLTGQMEVLYRAGADTGNGDITNIIYMGGGKFLLWLSGSGTATGDFYTLGQCPSDYWQDIFDLIPGGYVLNILLAIRNAELLTKKCLNADGGLSDSTTLQDYEGPAPAVLLSNNIAMDSSIPAIIGVENGFALLFSDGTLSEVYGQTNGQPLAAYYVNSDSLYVSTGGVNNSYSELYQCDLVTHAVSKITMPEPTYSFVGFQNGYLILYDSDTNKLYSYKNGDEVSSILTSIETPVNNGYTNSFYAGSDSIVGLGYTTGTSQLNLYQRFIVNADGTFVAGPLLKYDFGSVPTGAAMQLFYRNGEACILLQDSLKSETISAYLLTSPYVKINLSSQTGVIRCGC